LTFCSGPSVVVADDLINLVEVERVERAGLLRRARTCFAAIVTR
jgi:hypothetical protein